MAGGNCELLRYKLCISDIQARIGLDVTEKGPFFNVELSNYREHAVDTTNRLINPHYKAQYDL
jgi:hypothetical protein